MKKLLFLLSLLPVMSFGQAISLDGGGGTGDVSFTDTLEGGKIATQYMIDQIEVGDFDENDEIWVADSANVLHWADTLTKIASIYDVSLKLNTADALQEDNSTIRKSVTTIYVDTTVIATQYDISGFIITETDGIWAADSSKVLHFADTLTGGKIATKAEVAAIEVGDFEETDEIWAADSANVLHWADTLTKIASQYDISGFQSEADVAGMINDTMTAYINAAVEGVALADSSGTAVGSYVTGYDGSLLAPKASPTFSGTITLGDVSNTELGYLNNVTSAIQTQLNAKAGLTAARLLADTIPLFVFGAGGGNNADSNAFTTSTNYGIFRNNGSDTIVVTELRVFTLAGAGNDTLSVDVMWNDTLSATVATHLNTTALAIGRVSGVITARTIGQVDASFNNSKIPPGYIVWCTTPYIAVGRKPEMLTVQISGYKIPKY